VQNQAVVRLLPFACRKMQQRAGVAVREQCARADCCGVAQESSEAPSSSGGALQPLVMGATLSPNPLVVLVVTIGAGALFGMIGLTLAAPLTSAAVHIANEPGNRDPELATVAAVPAPSG
jgi:hypothetical protein